VFGFGYWRDIYSEEMHGLNAVAHTFIIPFFRIIINEYIIREQDFSDND